MSNELLNKIINLDGFIVEDLAIVDKTKVYIRPLYVELLSLHPAILRELADEISEQIIKNKPQILYAIEAAILPIASLVSNNLNIPMSIIRKPRNYKHENEEPKLFIKKGMQNNPSVLLDDAIWSGYTINHTFRILKQYGIQPPFCYFIFDFMDFNGGGRFLSEQDLLYLQKKESWAKYNQVVEVAHINRKISDATYQKTMLLFE